MFLMLEQAQRMLEEKAQLDLLSTTASWLVSHYWTLTDGSVRDVCVDAELNIHGVVRRVRLVYPRLFPETPAFILPQGAEERWSLHQYGRTGALCLEYGPDNWQPVVTGADVLESCARLLLSEAKSGEEEAVPSRHSLTLGQQLRGTYQRFIKTRGFSDLANSLDTGSITKIAVAINLLDLVMVAFCTASGVSNLVEHDELPKALSDPKRYGSWVQSGFLVVDGELRLPGSVTFEELKAALLERLLWPFEGPFNGYKFLAVMGANRELRVFDIAQPDGKEPKSDEFEVIEGAEDDGSRLPLAYRELSEKTVAIVGLGSVGSKIAVSLARSGLRKFILVDEDILLPGNLVRNQLDWTMVGFSKVSAVAEAITRVAANSVVEKRSHRLAGQENSEVIAATLNKIRTADLVIDATASPDVFVSLAAVCKRFQKAFIWGELFVGGIGALMCRSIPGIDASPLSVRDGVNLHLATLPKAPHMRASGYDDAEDDGPLLATDAAVTQLAASMAAYALDALTRKVDPEYIYPAYLMGYAQAWAFAGPFDTQPISVSNDDLSVEEPELSEEQTEARDNLFREILVNAKLIPPEDHNHEA
jgi:molybdopterin/thiamine biosynthesis adenylyltransferase